MDGDAGRTPRHCLPPFPLKLLFFLYKWVAKLPIWWYFIKTRGEMVEWFKAAVLKTAEGQLSEGSNPSFSAIFFV